MNWGTRILHQYTRGLGNNELPSWESTKRIQKLVVFTELTLDRWQIIRQCCKWSAERISALLCEVSTQISKGRMESQIVDTVTENQGIFPTRLWAKAIVWEWKISILNTCVFLFFNLFLKYFTVVPDYMLSWMHELVHFFLPHSPVTLITTYVMQMRDTRSVNWWNTTGLYNLIPAWEY